MPKTPNLQERIFQYIRSLGMTNGQKHELCKTLYGKSQVCLLTRDQGLDLETKLKAWAELNKDEYLSHLNLILNPPVEQRPAIDNTPAPIL